MEKLIELLDKFRRENKTKELFGEPGTLVPLTGKDFIELNRVMIISKEYGFIKWLVENNKIDIERLHKIVDYRLEIKENYLNAHNYNSDCLIMLLAISNTPTKDLISYLK